MNTNNTIEFTPVQSLHLQYAWDAYNSPAYTEAEAELVAAELALQYGLEPEQVEMAFDRAKNFQGFTRFFAGLVAAKKKGATEESVLAAVGQFSDDFIADKAKEHAAQVAYFNTDVLKMVSRPLPSQETNTEDNQSAVTADGLAVFDELFFEQLTQMGVWDDARKSAQAYVLAQAEMGGVSAASLQEMDRKAAATAALRKMEEAMKKEADSDALAVQLGGASLDGPATFGEYTPDPAVRVEQVRRSKLLRKYTNNKKYLLEGLVLECAALKADRGINKKHGNKTAATAAAVAFKATVGLINRAMAQVTNVAARAVVAKDFEAQEVVAIFNFEGREININKAAGEPVPAGLFSDDNPLFHMTAAEIRSTFEEWKLINAVQVFKLSFQRNTVSWNGIWTFTTPPDAIALTFHKLHETRDGFGKEYIYRSYTLETAIAEAWIKAQVSYALTTRSSAYGGAAKPHNADLVSISALFGR